MKRLLFTVLAMALALTGFGAPRAAAEPVSDRRFHRRPQPAERRIRQQHIAAMRARDVARNRQPQT